jgi:protocatechuate 3,4-dioxygenase beta subunit
LWDSDYRLIGTTTTDAGGHFTFTHLFNGQYTVSVNRSDPQLADKELTASP